ncbi:MAG TPA: Rieske 2Fe-2S domain-containing protein [Acidimicrobiales bacterium]|nr:Rieske 2Fe-2S domain-containing protein [Acidimicrobiales bacterium]
MGNLTATALRRAAGLSAAAEQLGRIEDLDRLAKPLARAVHQLVPSGSTLKDALSGTSLGHPVHPMLTDLPIGSFTTATVLDLIGGKRARRGADLLVAIGLLSAVPTALAGASDWSETYGEDQRIGVVHAASNTVGLACYTLSLAARWRGRRLTGKALALAGMSAMTVGGYLGGYLSYSRGIGVNNTFFHHQPQDWTPVLPEADVEEGKPVRAAVGDTPVVVFRVGASLYALDSRCTHAGGPLDEGDFDAATCTVRCPWHHSVFNVVDGAVVHGPASSPEPAYEVRVNEGQIEVRQLH